LATSPDARENTVCQESGKKRTTKQKSRLSGDWPVLASKAAVKQKAPAEASALFKP
jgi:hypothetical protein